MPYLSCIAFTSLGLFTQLPDMFSVRLICGSSLLTQRSIVFFITEQLSLTTCAAEAVL